MIRMRRKANETGLEKGIDRPMQPLENGDLPVF
jgi:hypothetical protein